MLWLVFGLNLAEFYALQSWLPTILANLGSFAEHGRARHFAYDDRRHRCGVCDRTGDGPAWSLRVACDRLFCGRGVCRRSWVMAVSAPAWVLLIAAFCAGFCISGGQKSVIALSAIFYPAPIRSTGVGWALGIGRLGGIGGPLLVGAPPAYQLSIVKSIHAAAFRCCCLQYWSCSSAKSTAQFHSVALCVPKIRFCNIDGEGRQGQVVRRRRRGAQSRDGEGRPCSEIDGSSTHYNRRHIRVGSGAGALRQTRSCGRDIRGGSSR